MKKNLLLLIITCILSLSVNSQIINTDISNYKSFDSGTTYFVKTGNDDLDGYIDALLSKYWTINNFEMIPESKVVQESNENNFYASFFTYSFSREAGSTGALNMDYTVTKLLFFKALTEAKKEIRQPIGTLSTIELSEVSPAEILYSIRVLHSQIELVKELKYKKALKFKKFLSEISEKRKSILHDKVLYVSEEQLSPRSREIEEIKKYYEHPFEIKSKEEIENAILYQEANVVYARFIRLGTLHFLMIIDAENSNLIYGKVSTGFTQDMIGPRFFKDMSK